MAEDPLAIYEELDPKLLDMAHRSRDLALSDGELPRKMKLLIALALDAAAGAPDGVASLARMALQAGATKTEIAEALRVAHYIAGVGSVYTAARGLKGVI